MVICCTCQWIQQDRSMSHLSFYDSEGIFLRPQCTLDSPFCLMRTITCPFMHHYITKVCSCWVAFETGPHFAVALACFLRNVGFAKVPLVHYILNEPSYPGNKKMNGFSKYPLWVTTIMDSLLQRPSAYIRTVDLIIAEWSILIQVQFLSVTPSFVAGHFDFV